ncbi:acyl-CoA synthetase [Variovorax sp. H27-G14]|uniref:acyl-CoA synthetase n=1 Tax=Variovorax sp. H27-G14 TaxID=3111914 RepID=UPI0038FC3FD3
MTQLTDYTTFADAQAHCSTEKLWALFSGDRQSFNIAHECVDRHASSDKVAIVVAYANGSEEVITFKSLSRLSNRFANLLVARGVQPGDRVAVMLEPSLAFYVAIFGAIKTGAIAVPLFTLFGPDGIRLRMEDCKPRMLVTNAEKAPVCEGMDGVDVFVADGGLLQSLAAFPDTFEVRTNAEDYAIFQYTSGTTRELPAAVKHRQRALVTLMLAALYGTGIRPGDRFFCPSSPAWGHGLWHGTLAPLALGVTIGAYSGKFDAPRLLKALQHGRFNAISAAATHFRMMRNSGAADKYKYYLQKVSFTGEPMDSETEDFVRATFGRPVCSMYGTTEIGVVLVNYPGANDFKVKPGSLGKPIPGGRIDVQDPQGRTCAPGVVGELKVWRNDAWMPTKDLGKVDADGYFFHAGRADDVIISAGWTMSAVEIEDAVLKHPDVREAAAIGVPDELRGQVVKAFVVTEREGSEAFTKEIQDLVRSRLSQHEYPRHVVFVSDLPKTPAGKVHRKVLRDREREPASA